MAYTITREQAAEDLGISTRTIDRYVKRGKLSYKKVANKVLLDTEQLHILRDEFNLLRQSPESEIVQETRWSATSSMAYTGNLDEMIDKKIEKFFTIFNEKEKIINDKDKMIFVLQQRVGELESKIKNMIALPDYSKEKQAILIEKQKLEDTISMLKGDFKKEKTKGTVFAGVLLIIVFAIIIMVFLNK